MAHVAIIHGISGCERYLAEGKEVLEVKKARKFRSPDAAKRAAEAHIEAFPAVVQRHMKFTVEEAR